MQVSGQAMVNGCLPVGPGHWSTLVVGDGDERHLSVLCEQVLQVRSVQPPVQGRDARARVAAQQWEVQIIAVEVNDIEPGHILEDQLQQPQVVRQRLPTVSVPPQGAGTGRNQLCPRLRVAAREQRDLMSQPYQFLGQVGDNALRTPVEFGRHALVKGSDLCDPHSASPVRYGPYDPAWKGRGGSLFLILDPDLGQPFAVLLEVADLDQRRPQLNRALDDADDVVHNPQ